MLHRLILKVTKFQFPPPKRLGTVGRNMWGKHHAPPMSNRVKKSFQKHLKMRDGWVKTKVIHTGEGGFEGVTTTAPPPPPKFKL